MWNFYGKIFVFLLEMNFVLFFSSFSFHSDLEMIQLDANWAMENDLFSVSRIHNIGDW